MKRRNRNWGCPRIAQQIALAFGVEIDKDMVRRILRRHSLPEYLSSDHDPLYRFHQWPANLRVLGVTEIKTVPNVPFSHPFVERLIGTVRREYLDRILFWTTADLEAKLVDTTLL
jgi:putative transposase